MQTITNLSISKEVLSFLVVPRIKDETSSPPFNTLIFILKSILLAKVNSYLLSGKKHCNFSSLSTISHLVRKYTILYKLWLKSYNTKQLRVGDVYRFLTSESQEEIGFLVVFRVYLVLICASAIKKGVPEGCHLSIIIFPH